MSASLVYVYASIIGSIKECFQAGEILKKTLSHWLIKNITSCATNENA